MYLVLQMNLFFEYVSCPIKTPTNHKQNVSYLLVICILKYI